MTRSDGITATFWGVRGSVPTPTLPSEQEEKIVQAIWDSRGKQVGNSLEEVREWVRGNMPFEQRSTFGGNTTCLEVRCDDFIIILDMGTGLRELGNRSLMPQTLRDKGINVAILQTHVHWDHIQGMPFWKQLYMPRALFDNRATFYGHLEWRSKLEEVLHGQMSAPCFPVDLGKLKHMALNMEFAAVEDGQEFTLRGPRGPITILPHRLNHPQDTYGYRITYRGQVLAFCTDHEPHAGIHGELVALAREADVFATDTQYSEHEYKGTDGGVSKVGWGHSYPEYIAQVVEKARPELTITTHHDPDASDQRIIELAATVERLSGRPCIPAYEGLTISC